MTQSELKPCPFCGASAEWAWHSGDALWLQCSKCAAIGPQDEETTDVHQEKTVAAWNTRTPPSPSEPLVERARELLASHYDCYMPSSGLGAEVRQGVRDDMPEMTALIAALPVPADDVVEALRVARDALNMCRHQWAPWAHEQADKAFPIIDAALAKQGG